MIVAICGKRYFCQFACVCVDLYVYLQYGELLINLVKL